MTTKPHEKDVKHPEKHAKEPEKHPPQESTTRRVEFHNATSGDETTVGHGTKSYPVPRDGIVDLPHDVAEHVIRQGGAKPLDKPSPEPEGSVKVKHVSDSEALLSYGQDSYKADKNGVMTVPLGIVAEAEAHGFLLV